MCIAPKEDKENEEGNVKKIRHKKIEKIQRQKNSARWNEIESETEEIRSKKKFKKTMGCTRRVLVQSPQDALKWDQTKADVRTPETNHSNIS